MKIWKENLAMKKTFICLANSRKLSGLCIAGKTLDDLSSFRPISSRSTEELSEIEIRYKNGQLPKLLDVITVEIKNAKPNGFQPENYLIDTDYYWSFDSHFNFDDLDKFIDNPSCFWTNTESSYNGKNDRIDPFNFNTIKKSYIFLKLTSSTIIVREEGREFGNPKRKVRLRFVINNKEYVLPITHPEVERYYLGKDDGEYIINEVHYVSVSSGMPHIDGKIYLFAAGIIRNGIY